MRFTRRITLVEIKSETKKKIVTFDQKSIDDEMKNARIVQLIYKS